MEKNILFPLGIFPVPVRHIVESLQKYEHYQVDFTAVSFFTAFAAAMGNTWSARFMTGWVSRPILYVVLVGPPSCGKTPPLRQAVAPLLKLDEASDHIYLCAGNQAVPQMGEADRQITQAALVA